MVSIGGGRQCYFGAKETTDDYRTVALRRWREMGSLSPAKPVVGNGLVMERV